VAMILFKEMSHPSTRRRRMKNVYMIGVVILLILAIPIGVAAVPHHCDDGEEWQNAVYGPCEECPTQTTQDCHFGLYRQYKIWGYANNGQCVSDCQPDGHGNQCAKSCNSWAWGTVCTDVTEYVCHEEGYVSCDGPHHEKEVITPAGCVAVSCPAIPCDTGFECIDNQCVSTDPCYGVVCPEEYQICYLGECIGEPPECETDADCQEGYTCLDGFCIPPKDPCADIQCQDGYYCDGGECIWIPECQSDRECKGGYICVDGECVKRNGDGMSPYTESACQAIVGSQRPMDDIDPSTLPMLNLHDTYISASFKYSSQFDCVDLAFYTRGEPSYNAICSEVEYWNSEQTEVHSYGSLPILYAPDPSKAICILAVKNTPGETTLPVEITLTDSFGTKIPSIVSSDPVISKCYQLPDDFDSCRMRNTYVQFSPWVGK
jgi:hypothetical protein